MREWKISTEKKLSEIRVIYEKVSDELKQTKNVRKEKAQKLLEEATFNIDIVEKGKSVHNVEYSQELLTATYNILVEALNVIGSSYKPEAFLGLAKEIPTQCSNCHTGIEEINTQIFGLDFPHKKHLIEQKIQCSTCHSNVRKHGEFVASKHGCAVCHHKDIEKDCTFCHQLQTTIYEGGQLNGHRIPKDIMFEAEIECIGCHLDSRDQIYRPDKNKCVDCHEEEYGDIFLEWQNSVKDLIRSLKNTLTKRKKLSLPKEQQVLVLNIEKSLEKIELDGSSGIHNYSAIEEMLTNFQKTLESIGKNTSDEQTKIH